MLAQALCYELFTGVEQKGTMETRNNSKATGCGRARKSPQLRPDARKAVWQVFTKTRKLLDRKWMVGHGYGISDRHHKRKEKMETFDPSSLDPCPWANATPGWGTSVRDGRWPCHLEDRRARQLSNAVAVIQAL